MAYDFKDKKDFDVFHSWTLRKATSRANDGFNIIEFYERFGRVAIDSTETENYDFWSFFHIRLAETYSRSRTVDKIRRQYPWGVWRLAKDGIINHAPALRNGSTYRAAEGLYQYHQYPSSADPDNNNPSPEEEQSGPIDDWEIRWDLSIAEQDAKQIFVGVARIGEIDAVSSVPHLPTTINGRDGTTLLSGWATTDGIGMEHWQRQPDPNRILAIQNFMDTDASNYMLNAIMLYIPQGAAGITIVENENNTATIRIRPSEFLVPLDDRFTDLRIDDETGEVTDFRPLWIVDGQHRTRGMALSQRGHEMAVPVIVLYESEQGHGLTDVAKLFTEINTLADALNEELSHYLAYKFKIMGYKKMAYDLPSDEMNEDERRLRIQNRESYRLACDLNQSETFRNGICLIPGKNAVTRITLKKWQEEARKWFNANGIFGDVDMPYVEKYSIIENIFKAWDTTLNYHVEGEGRDLFENAQGIPRWRVDFGSDHSIIEQPNIVRNIIVQNISWLVQYCEHLGMEKTEDAFTQILAPIRPVDWRDLRAEHCFVKGGEPPATWVRNWIRCAIVNNGNYSIQQINSEEIDDANNQGAGLYSRPSTPTIDCNANELLTTITVTWDSKNVHKFEKPTMRLSDNVNPNSISTTFESRFPSVENDFELIPSKLVFEIEDAYIPDGHWHIEFEATNCAGTRTFKIQDGEFLVLPEE